MIPATLRPAYPGIVAPRSGLKLTRVAGYGRVELRNGADRGVAIVPLHIGYVQDQAQNHALCRSAFLAARHGRARWSGSPTTARHHKYADREGESIGESAVDHTDVSTY